MKFKRLNILLKYFLIEAFVAVMYFVDELRRNVGVIVVS